MRCCRLVLVDITGRKGRPRVRWQAEEINASHQALAQALRAVPPLSDLWNIRSAKATLLILQEILPFFAEPWETPASCRGIPYSLCGAKAGLRAVESARCGAASAEENLRQQAVHGSVIQYDLLIFLVEKEDPGSQVLAGKSTLNRLELTKETASRKDRYTSTASKGSFRNSS